MPRGRVTRVVRASAAILGGLIALSVLGASVVLQGPRLGRLIEGSLPANRGKLHIGGVTWSLRALLDLVTDEPSPIAVDGLQIVDPEGTVVLDVPHLTARVKLRTLIGGSFSIHELRAPVATWRFAQLRHGEGIGFLAALAPKNAPPPPPADKASGPGSFFEIAGAELGDLTALFDFPGAWGLELRHAHARASLKQSSVDPKHPSFGFDAGPVVAEGGGWLRILDDNVLPFDRVTINRVATTPDWPDDIFLDLPSAQTGRSVLSAKGFFTGIYGETSVPGIKLHASFAEAGDALSAVVAGKQIDDLTFSGAGAAVTADLSDTFARLKVAAAFRGVDVAYAAYRGLGLGFDLGFDAGAGKVDLTRFSLGAPGGGTVALDAHLDTNTLGLNARLGCTDVDTRSYLPSDLRAMAAGRLNARVEARGNLAKKTVRVSPIDVRFARPRAGGLPREAQLSGAAEWRDGKLRTDGLTLAVTGARATMKGTADIEGQRLDVSVGLNAPALPALLREMGLPPLASTVVADARATGSFDDPSIAGHVSVRGVNAGGERMPELLADFGLEHGTARLDHLSGAVLGGRIDGHGTLQLWQGRTTKPLPSPVVDVQIDGRDLDLAMLAGGASKGDADSGGSERALPPLRGRLSLHALAKGPLDALEAEVTVPAGTQIVAYGGEYDVGPVEVALQTERPTRQQAGRKSAGASEQTVVVRRLHIGQRGGNGALDVEGKMGLARRDLDLRVVLDRLPLQTLPGVGTAGLAVTGLGSAHLHAGGRADRPELEGEIDLAAVEVRGTPLGAARLVLRPGRIGPTEAPGVIVQGRLFDRFDVDGQAALTSAGPIVHAALAFQHLALESLTPEVVALGDGKGLASGRIGVDLQPGQPLVVDVLLPELWISIARPPSGPNGDSTLERVRIEAARPLHVAVRGAQVILDEAHFTTEGGDLMARGALDGKAVYGELDGHLNLDLLQPVLRLVGGDSAAAVDRLSGDLEVGLKLKGTLDAPDVRGQLTITNPIRAHLAELDREVVISNGTVAVGSSGVSLDNLAVTVDGSTMRLSGRAGLGPGFVPRDMEAEVDGDVSARLLALLAPDAVSDAHGRAHVRARLGGTLQKPDIRGRLDLGTIDFRLRDLGAEIEIQSGLVEISNEGAILHNVKVTIDDQGVLVIGASGVRAGRVQFTSLSPFRTGPFDLPLHGERLSYRSPDVFEADDVGFDLDLKGNMSDGFTLAGEVRLVSGRYLQDFKVQDLVLSPRVNESSVRPFYEGKPLLEGLGLDLSVRTVGDGFVVQNNIAPEIHVDILLHVGGTLAAPQLAGDVRPTDGRFNIPFMRGDFDLVQNVNHVTFVATKSLAEGDTPDLDLQATNSFTDANGNPHQVLMHISGPLREARIDLSTDTGLDTNQTALLLITGRTTTDTQRVSTQNATVGANVGTAADVAGQATRDTVASLMEPYIDDTFQRLTGLNLRLTVGSDGFEGRVRKRITRHLSFQSDYLQGFRSDSHWVTQGDVWLRDYVTMGMRLEQIRLSSDQGVAETLPWNIGAEIRLDFPIRW